MKKLLYPFVVLAFLSMSLIACEEVGEILKEVPLTKEEVAKGLKAALSKGTNSGTASASKVDGYLKNELIKILLPKEIKEVKSFLDTPPAAISNSKILNPVFKGLTSKINEVPDQLLVAMNRGAESAAKEAKPIFLTAITKMTITDAFAILKGEDKQAATNYLRRVTKDTIISKFAPKIDAALSKTNATNLFTKIVSTYNDFIPKYNTAVSLYNASPFSSGKVGERTKIEPNLGKYATAKAAEGLFKLIAKEEEEIRKNPLARTTELLKKVFKKQDSNQSSAGN